MGYYDFTMFDDTAKYSSFFSRERLLVIRIKVNVFVVPLPFTFDSLKKSASEFQAKILSVLYRTDS